MRWTIILAPVLILALIIIAPLLIPNNYAAQALFGIITTAVSTSVGVWASWKYSKNTDKERLTRYGLLAWRNIDALSVKVRQQILHGSARAETLESWLLDIDGAKWAWKDLLREVFELQERLTLEKEEVALEYKTRMSTAGSDSEREKIFGEFKLKLARIRQKAPLPIREEETLSCPRCGNNVTVSLGSEPGSTTWPECAGCGAIFPVHRKNEGEVSINADALKLPVSKNCPYCNELQSWKVQVYKPVHFLYYCTNCENPIQCDGVADDFQVSKKEEEAA